MKLRVWTALGGAPGLRQRLAMRSPKILALIYLTSVGMSGLCAAQDRPIPSRHQTYHKAHPYLPGVSTIEPAFVHLPIINDPSCCECQQCQPRLVESFAQHVHAKLDTVECLLEQAGVVTETPPFRLSAYGGAELIRWSTNAPAVAPLVTTSTPGTLQPAAGVLGQASTSTVVGGGLYDDNRMGGRYTGALVIDTDSRWIVEAVYTIIGDDELFRRADSNRYGIVARPFYNSDTSLDDARLVVFPGVASGRVDIDGSTSFDTFQIALRRGLGQVLGANTDYTIGYRKAQLDDMLQIFDVTNSLAGPTAGSRFEVRDTFRADNQFDGVDLGLIARWRKTPRLSFDLLGKASLGHTESVVRIDGRTITRPAGGARTGTPGGLLAQTTNIGRFRDSGFGAIFEIGATLRYQFRDNVQGTLGYTFLNWQNIARVTDQLDDSVNPTQFPPGPLVGDPRPRFRFDHSNFNAHGLRIGVQISL